MNAHLIRPLILGVFAFPLLVAAQQGGEGRQAAAVGGGQGAQGQIAMYSDPGNNFFSNVPINELSPRAYRRFHRLFRGVPAGESWFKYEKGYQVSFTLEQHHEFAYFDPSGAFLYSLRYFEGSELSKDMTNFVKSRFPDYKIDI